MRNKIRQFILKQIGKIGYYPKRIKFRESTRYAKEVFGNKPITIAEIGVDEGKNSLVILENLNVEKIYLIDPYEDYEGYRAIEGVSEKNYINSARKSAMNRLRKYKDKIVWVREYSEKAADKIPKCDFIYVDGNHHYEYVKKDLKLFFDKVKDGGVFAGHDIERKGVFKAVSEFVVKNKLDSWASYPDWIIRKPLKKK